MEYINLLKEEWIYHLSNIGIICLFSIYGAYMTVNKKIKLEIFREYERNTKTVSSEKKEEIRSREMKGLLQEFFKAFFALFTFYAIYIVYRLGIFS